jgi:hypothetical protein
MRRKRISSAPAGRSNFQPPSAFDNGTGKVQPSAAGDEFLSPVLAVVERMRRAVLLEERIDILAFHVRRHVVAPVVAEDTVADLGRIGLRRAERVDECVARGFGRRIGLLRERRERTQRDGASTTWFC